jgi:hypothetical protein
MTTAVMCRIKMAGYDDNHPLLMSSQTGDNKFCADSWCDGGCGYPALVCMVQGRERKAYGSMVACGAVWQPFRLKWTGQKHIVEIPEEDAIKAWWC